MPTGTGEPFVLRSGEGIEIEARGSHMVLKATGVVTDGAFSLMERELPPRGTPPPLHVHDGVEAFYVLEGTITFILEDQTVEGGPGDYVFVPRGARHTFGNQSSEEARLLILHSPAMDGYFFELEELWLHGIPDSQAVEELMARYGMVPA